MKLQLFLLCSAICALTSGCEEGFRYELDRLMDEALQGLAKSVDNSSVVEITDTLTVGGFALTNPKLGELTTFRRLSPAWLVPSMDEVRVIANLTMGTMYVEADRLDGPDGVALNKTRISVKSSLISINFRAKANPQMLTKNLEGPVIRGCNADYAASIERLSSVDIEIKDKTVPIDDWVQRMLPQITPKLDRQLGIFFQANLDLCKILRAENYYL